MSRYNKKNVSFLDFAIAFELVVVNLRFSKKDDHLVIFLSKVAKTRIDYFLLRKSNKVLYRNCKVVLNENLTAQHKLLVMDVEIER